jgi:cytochrome c-type biogenesis protein
MFLFGVSYATVSLSCTLPLFLPVMTRTLGSSSFGSGLAGILTYAAGMGLVLCALTVALGSARHGLVTKLRRVQPHIDRISGGLLVLAGAYVAYYGYWEHRIVSDPLNPPPSGVVNRVTDLSSRVTNLVSDVGATRIGIVLAAAVAVAVILAFGSRRDPEPADDPESTTV